MKQVDEGGTPTEKLFFYLEEFFQLPVVNINGGGFYDQIAYIENHKGNWRIGFKAVPAQALLLAICALFETRLSYDGIEEVIFHYNTPMAHSVKDVAGCLEMNDGISRVLAAHKKLFVRAVS